MRKILFFIVLVSLVYGCAPQNSSPKLVSGNIKDTPKVEITKPSQSFPQITPSEKYYELYNEYLEGKYSAEEFMNICNKEIHTARLDNATIAELYGYITLALVGDKTGLSADEEAAVYDNAAQKAYEYNNFSVFSVFLYSTLSNLNQCEKYSMLKYVINNIDENGVIFLKNDTYFKNDTNQNYTIKEYVIDFSQKTINRNVRACIGNRPVTGKIQPDNSTIYYLDGGSLATGTANFFVGEELYFSKSIENGILHGMSTVYTDGRVSSITYYDHGAITKSIEYDPATGQILNEFENLSDRETIGKIYENGVLTLAYKYLDDNHVGTIGYYPSGKIKSEFIGKKINFYYESGSLESMYTIKDGVFNGKFENYYESGKVKEAGQFNKGELDGKIVEYFEEGQLQSERYYKDGILNGERVTYYKNGKIDRKYIYKKGIQISEQNYRENGKPWFDMIYKDGKLVSGYCILSATGVKVPLTNAEMTNWNNGLSVTCP